MGWLKRLWRSRGHGVHSPFAFRFITECLEEKLPYYDYAHLPSETDRLILRVAALMQPCEMASGSKARAMVARRTVAKEASAPKWVGMDSTRLLIADSHSSAAELRAKLAAEWVAVIEGPALVEAAERTLDELGCGMMFRLGRKLGVAVPWRRLPRATYTVM